MIEDLVASAPETAKDVFSFPLSFAQRRLWFLHRLEPSSAYNVPLLRRLRGKLDVPALERALNELVARHEMLRTSFGTEDGMPCQLIHPAGEEALEILDLSAEPIPEIEMDRVVLGQAQLCFDLEAGPPRRAVLLRLGTDDHVFVLTLHHIVCDGWSVSILFRDLDALYVEFAGGPPANLPELPIQYADYAVSQQEWMQGEVLDEQIAYWRGKLEGAPTALDLPTDHLRPAVQSSNGQHVMRTLPTDLLQRLKALSQAEGATLFMTLLAAFEFLLGRYSGQREVLVGTPVANRQRLELEDLIGFLTNTLVLRLGATSATSFRALLASVRETVLEAEAHQDLPFEVLVEELNPPRDRSRTPLFQVMFSLYNTPDSRVVQLPDLTLEGVPLERATSKFDLSLFMRETTDGLRTTFEYSTDLFEQATIERMSRHLETLLEEVARDPDRSLDDIEIIDDDERRTLLVEWNATGTPYSGHRVDELFAAQAAATPDAIAVEAGAERLSYSTLDRRSNRLARRLQQLGIGPDRLVGLCLDRTADLPVALLGILKAGGAYVPLDPAYPADRLAFMLEDSDASVVLTQQSLLAALPHTQAQILCIDRDWPEIECLPAEPIESASGHGNRAVVIYTSGSTGTPKGVETLHGAVVNLLSSVQNDVGFGPDDVFLATTTLSFDIAAVEQYLPLVSGGRVALAPTGAAADPSVLARLLDRHSASFMQATPSGWKLLLDGGWAGRRELTALTAGEPLTAELADALLGRVDALWNYYGPSETTIYSTGTRVEQNERVTIGRPVANTTTYVLDERLKLTPIGIPGELHIGGDGLARGYLNRAQLTAERFIAHPFDPAAAAKLYKTGDLVRYRGDGKLEYLGRLDHQVKIRGYRIELGEIEAALLRHAGLRDAVVVAREDVPGDRRLVAYVVPQAAPGPTAAELKAHLRKSLPEFMVPAAFVTLSALPLGPSRKVDRGALPPPDRSQSTEATLVAPRDEVEATLVDIWKRLLGLRAEIGVQDDFFDLGGHSLLAVQLMALIGDAFGIRLPLATLFDSATIEGLAGRVVEARSHASEWPTLVPLRATGTKPPLFFLHGHDGELLYFRDLVRGLEPDQPAYGVQPVGLDGRARPFRSVHEMASHYADEILSFRPRGPHLLIGYCFSGILAYELAHQLEQRGHPPALLALIDAPPQGLNRSTRADVERRKFKEFLETDARGKWRWIVRRARGLAAKIGLRARLTLADLLGFRGGRRSRVRGNMTDAIGRARRGYVTPSSSLRVTLFRAAEDEARARDQRSDWSRLAGDVDVHPIVAEGIRHDNIVREPYVALLASELETCIRQALELPSR
jgi:amino acid adenylation domain-containing protein